MARNAKIRIGRLDYIGGVVKELGTVYRQMRREELDKSDGERLARVLTMIRSALEVSDIERRLAELEARNK